jgi:C1A family cysteine protease
MQLTIQMPRFQNWIGSQERWGFPSSKDWRSEGKVTSVKQQGSCGACWAFSATAVYESLLMMKVNRTEDLSEEYVLECSGANSNCGGGYVQDAYNLMINTGIPTETAFPYLGTRSGSVTPSTPGICSSTNFVTLPSKTTSKQYRNLTNENLRNLVATAPVVVLIYADLGFTSYKSGIYGCSKANVTKDDLNHAVVIVGYDDTKFIVKNSYGKDWGQEGYMDLNISNNCGINLYVYELSNDYEPPAPAPAPTPAPAPAPTPIQATPESPKSAIRLLSLLAVVLFSLLIVN